MRLSPKALMARLRRPRPPKPETKAETKPKKPRVSLKTRIHGVFYNAQPPRAQAWLDRDICEVVMLDSVGGKLRRCLARHSEMRTLHSDAHDQSCWYPLVGVSHRYMLAGMFGGVGAALFGVLWFMEFIHTLAAIPLALLAGFIGYKLGFWLSWRTEPLPIWFFRIRPVESLTPPVIETDAKEVLDADD